MEGENTPPNLLIKDSSPPTINLKNLTVLPVIY